MSNRVSVEFSTFELDTLYTFLAMMLNAPDYWPGVSMKQDAAMACVLSRVSEARDRHVSQ